MTIEQEFGRGSGPGDGLAGASPEGPLPWWDALELHTVREAEADLASAGDPVEPEAWMVHEWDLLGSPESRLVRVAEADQDLFGVIAADLEQLSRQDPDWQCRDATGRDATGRSDTDRSDTGRSAPNLPPHCGDLLSTAVVAADLEDEAADVLIARLLRLDAEDAARAGERIVLLAALARERGNTSDDPFRRLDSLTIAASEVSAALKVSARTAKGMVTDAVELDRSAWRPLIEAMRSGLLPQRRVRTIMDAAIPVPPAKLAAFVVEAIAIAAPLLPDGGLDADRIPSQGALGRRLRLTAEDYSAEPLAVRKAAARERRRIDIEPAGDAMCWLTAYLPLEQAAAIDTALEAAARSLQGPVEQRTLSQLRADVFADLLLSPSGPADRSGAGAAAQIIVTVPARTLQNGSEAPGEILGYGPIDPDAARLLAGQTATWTRMWVDPGSGAPLAIGRTRYTPTAAMRRHLGARDMVCRFPGCDKPAALAEADHTTAWANGGETDVDNLASVCREHHRLKSEGHWRARQLNTPVGTPPARPPSIPPGTIEWTAPSGRRYITYPEGDPPPPF